MTNDKYFTPELADLEAKAVSNKPMNNTKESSHCHLCGDAMELEEHLCEWHKGMRQRMREHRKQPFAEIERMIRDLHAKFCGED